MLSESRCILSAILGLLKNWGLGKTKWCLTIKCSGMHVPWQVCYCESVISVQSTLTFHHYVGKNDVRLVLLSSFTYWTICLTNILVLVKYPVSSNMIKFIDISQLPRRENKDLSMSLTEVRILWILFTCRLI